MIIELILDIDQVGVAGEVVDLTADPNRAKAYITSGKAVVATGETPSANWEATDANGLNVEHVSDETLIYSLGTDQIMVDAGEKQLEVLSGDDWSYNADSGGDTPLADGATYDFSLNTVDIVISHNGTVYATVDLTDTVFA